MSGKYDPPHKKQLLAQFRRMPSTVEIAVAAVEAKYPPKVKDDNSASCARATDEATVDRQPSKRGRKPIVTAARVKLICDLLSRGETERGARIRVGIGATAWSAAKRLDSTLRDRIASAREDWARLRYQQHAAALYESQTAREACRKALKPSPTKQAKWVFWYLVARVPLNFVAIPEQEIVSACQHCGLPLETWRRQERAFGLMRKVYEKRSAIRGEQPAQSSPWNGWPNCNE